MVKRIKSVHYCKRNSFYAILWSPVYCHLNKLIYSHTVLFTCISFEFQLLSMIVQLVESLNRCVSLLKQSGRNIWKKLNSLQSLWEKIGITH